MHGPYLRTPPPPAARMGCATLPSAAVVDNYDRPPANGWMAQPRGLAPPRIVSCQRKEGEGESCQRIMRRLGAGMSRDRCALRASAAASPASACNRGEVTLVFEGPRPGSCSLPLNGEWWVVKAWMKALLARLAVRPCLLCRQ